MNKREIEGRTVACQLGGTGRIDRESLPSVSQMGVCMFASATSNGGPRDMAGNSGYGFGIDKVVRSVGDDPGQVAVGFPSDYRACKSAQSTWTWILGAGQSRWAGLMMKEGSKLGYLQPSFPGCPVLLRPMSCFAARTLRGFSVSSFLTLPHSPAHPRVQ